VKLYKDDGMSVIDRNELVPRKGHTAEIQDINEQCSGFRKQIGNDLKNRI